MAYTSAVLQSGKDVVFVVGSKTSESAIVNDDGKSWPAIKIAPDRSALCTEEFEVEAEG